MALYQNRNKPYAASSARDTCFFFLMFVFVSVTMREILVYPESVCLGPSDHDAILE